MHQTEGTNFNAADPDITGRAFQQEGGGTPGSVMFAEWANAVQQEIANVITGAGLTLETTAANDRTALWGQLRQAIFSSSALTQSAFAANSVGAPEIQTDAVTETKIVNSGVTLAKLNTDTYTKYKTKTRSTSMLAVGVVPELTMSPGTVVSPFRVSLNYVPFLNDSSATVRVAIKYGTTVIANVDLNVQDTTLTSNELDLSLGHSSIYNANGSSDFTVEVVALSSGCSASDFIFTLEELVHHTEEPTW